MIRELTCIVCPLGCALTVELMDGKVQDVRGNSCPRGKVYAENECTNPQRTVTSTVRCTDGTVLAVKTDRTIPKDKMRPCMDVINRTVAKLPVRVGDVIVENVFGAHIVATENKDA